MQTLALILLSALAHQTPAEGHTAASTSPKDGLPGYRSEEWCFPLEAGHRTRIVLRGDGSSDLDLILLDEQGVVAAADERPADLAILTFVPEHDGLYFLRVVNRGLSSNRYDLLVGDASPSLAGQALAWARDQVTRWLHLGAYWRLRMLRATTAFVPGTSAQRIALGLEAMAELSRAFPGASATEASPEPPSSEALAVCPISGGGTCSL